MNTVGSSGRAAFGFRVKQVCGHNVGRRPFIGADFARRSAVSGARSRAAKTGFKAASAAAPIYSV
jgi:hypothetical protein